MPRPSPQTDRVRWTLELFANDPTRSFSLAQIARHLGVSMPTCLPMVSALTSAGWLIRHPADKTYRLGPALVTLGMAAERSRSIDDLAMPLMLEIARQTPGMPCISFSVVGEHLVLREIVDADGQQLSWHGLRRGHQLRAVPPLASCLVTWGDDAAIDAWLARARPDDLDAARAHYESALQANRDRGYVVELEHPLERQAFFLTQRLSVEHRPEVGELLELAVGAVSKELDRLDVIATEIDPDASYTPVSINAPVFGMTDAIELVICSCTDAPRPLRGHDVRRIGELVRDSCATLTSVLNGRPPRAAPR